jgi:hypothetical protein
MVEEAPVLGSADVMPFRSPPTPEDLDREALADRARDHLSEAKLYAGFLWGLALLFCGVGAVRGEPTAVLVGILMVVFGYEASRRAFRRGIRIRRTAREGHVGCGTIVSARSAGLVVFVMEVKVDGYDKFHAESAEDIDPLDAARLVGQELPVVWHPKWPTQVLIPSLPQRASPPLGPRR